MLSFQAHLKVFVATAPCDLRASFNGLWAAAQERLGEDPKSGALFVFGNRRHNRLKVLCFDGSGSWVCAKRLERGRFTWSEAGVGSKVRLCAEELALLLGGLELTRVARRNWWRAE